MNEDLKFNKKLINCFIRFVKLFRNCGVYKIFQLAFRIQFSEKNKCKTI